MSKEEFTKKMLQEQRKRKIAKSKKLQYEYSNYHSGIVLKELKRR